ncbi:outer membrane protein OmpK [Escherichia coli]
MHAYGTYGSANRVNFHDDMFLYGIGYNFTGSGWWFKPFFAKRYKDQPITLATTAMSPAGLQVTTLCWGAKFTLTNWNEYEFDRDATYAAGNGGKEEGLSAVALWWNATSHITTGIQYRYADDKLGEIFTRMR